MKKDILKEKQNLLMIGAIILAIVVIAVILIFFVFKKDKGMTTETLENRLEKVGIDFYENYYYSGLTEEQKKMLPNFKENGIRIDITNAQLLVTIDQDVLDQLKKDNCNLDETKISIYPKEPYGQKDYTTKIELSCKK